MRKLVESTFMTLDGVINEPQNWSPPYWDEEHAAYASDLLAAADALVLGRKTYEAFAEAWPTRSGDRYADQINAMPKYVASRTLEEPDVERHRPRGRRGGGGRRAEGGGRREPAGVRHGGLLDDAPRAQARRRVPLLDLPGARWERRRGCSRAWRPRWNSSTRRASRAGSSCTSTRRSRLYTA